MSIANTGGPAFPIATDATAVSRGDGGGANYKIRTEQGMTLRDYFAAKAMQGLMSGRWKADLHGIPYDAYRADADEWAKSAYYFADAMLKAREA